MPKRHRVRDGEGIAFIAESYGFFPDTLWNHPENEGLRRACGRPNALAIGSEVFIPDKVVKEETAHTGLRHRYRKRGVPSRLRIRFNGPDGPRKGLPFRLHVDVEAEPKSGVTDAEGAIDVGVSPRARTARLVLLPEDGPEEAYHLELWGLLPATDVVGAQHRLRNLGYFSGEPKPEMSDEAVLALGSFQADAKLPVTGELDADTALALHKAHDGTWAKG